ncbi:MAG: hypothetical protein K2K25_02665 [Muribaculaceae bacterium]|nr:hypothetical protein [Muribaculaceae bacterium]
MERAEKSRANSWINREDADAVRFHVLEMEQSCALVEIDTAVDMTERIIA